MQYSKIIKRVILEEVSALNCLADNIPQNINLVVECILSINGKVILTGIGKSGYIANKIAASFASTGTTSFYIHPSEASHGDLGMITKDDLLMVLSKSGETQELFDIMYYCIHNRIKIVSITMNPESTLAKNSDYVLSIPDIKEASEILAPTSSVIMMLSIGDALTVAIQEIKNFSISDFQKLHPGGTIGKQSNTLKSRDFDNA